jgi:hypothetical protein
MIEFKKSFSSEIKNVFLTAQAVQILQLENKTAVAEKKKKLNNFRSFSSVSYQLFMCGTMQMSRLQVFSSCNFSSYRNKNYPLCVNTCENPSAVVLILKQKKIFRLYHKLHLKQQPSHEISFRRSKIFISSTSFLYRSVR